MPIKRVQFPDGSIRRVEVPDGATNEQILAFVQSQYKPKADKPYRPTDDMSGTERFLAGAGKSLVDTYEGTKQALTDSAHRTTGIVWGGLRAVGADGAADWLGRNVGAPVQARKQREERQAAERRSRDADLMSRGAGIGGNVVGTLAQMVGPGAIAKGAATVPQFVRAAPALSAAGRALLPTTVRGNAALGAAMGAAQPVVSDGERGTNVTIGGVAGAVGGALPRVVGGTVRAGRAATERLTRAGAQRRAVREVQAEATNPAALMQPAPSQVPGAIRSLADESQDAGVARMETRSRGNGKGWEAFDRSNNAARVEALRTFAGDDAALRGAVANRAASTAPLRTAAMQDSGVDTAPVRATIMDLIEKNRTRPTVAGTLQNLLNDSLDKADNGVQSLYGVRKYIDDVMTGKTDSKAGQAARAELVKVKSVLDEQIKAASPAFGNYLSAFIAGSRPIDRMKVGQALLRKGSGPFADDMGNPQLLPAQFGSAVKDLDALAARATKFRQADAASTLQPDDLATINAVNDDMARIYGRQKIGSGHGSHTNSQRELAERMTQEAAMPLISRVPGLRSVLQMMDEAGQRRLDEALTVVLQNPAEYRRVAASLPPMEAQALELALSRIGGRTGAFAPPLIEFAPETGGEQWAQ